MKSRRGPEDVASFLDARERRLAAAMASDSSLTPMVAAVEAGRRGPQPMVPAFFFWYRHAGSKEAWNRAEWNDPAMRKSFDEYFAEALSSGWWAGNDYPRDEHVPRVLIECGGNVLRRTRGGSKRLLESLWPGLDLVVTFEVKMSTTALFSDCVLPCAQQYEKIGFHFGTTHTMNLTFSDRWTRPARLCTSGRVSGALLRRWKSGPRRGAWHHSATVGVSFATRRMRTPPSRSTALLLTRRRLLMRWCATAP